MDIVILALNSKYIHSSLAPWYLKAEVPAATVLEHTVNEDIDTVLKDIVSLKPRILAISVYIWNIKYAERILELVKESLPDIITVVGGPEVSYNPKDVLERSHSIDYVISGEGEIPFSFLCNSIEHNITPNISGVSYRDHISEPFIGSGTPKSPYIDDYFTALNNRIAYFESSRGCPYSCAYCLSGRCERMRFFDMEYVKENLLKLAKSGTKTIKFVDRTFNAERNRAREIFSLIIEKNGTEFPRDVCFHFELSGDLLDDETVELLSSAPDGLFQFEIGIQSFYPKTINAIHRKTKSEVLKKRISQLIKLNNAHIHTDLIAGLPYEGYEDFINSFNEAYSLGADMLQLGFLKILHGTELEVKADEYGLHFSKNPPYEVYETTWLSNAEIKLLKTAESALDRIHNSGRFKRTVALCLPYFKTAYDFFYKCGRVIEDSHSLDEMTDKLYFYLKTEFPQKSEQIRDALVCDRIATNSSKGLPKSIYQNDARIGKIKHLLNNDEGTAEKKGIRRNIAILYGANKVVYADYDIKSHKNEYELKFLEL